MISEAAARALARAPTAKLPQSLEPQLATLASKPPASGEWRYEIKFDGYRLLARIERGKCRLFTRNGHDWTEKIQSLARAVAELGFKSAWLDCEAVVMGKNGKPSFNALQNAFDSAGTEAIQLFVFDLPWFNGKNLTELPLRLRREILKEELERPHSDRIRTAEAFDVPGSSILETACQMGLEGVIAKRQDAPYVSRRSETWLKLKCRLRQEFVIGGFTDRTSASRQIGSLLLGVYDDDGALGSVGSVGTGFNSTDASTLWKKLVALETKRSPFVAAHAPSKGRWSKRATGSERWVKPELVAEVRFGEWTPDGYIRHASFDALREDKEPSSIRRESPALTQASRAAKRASGIKVSHGERVIDASTGLTKLDLVLYYERIAEHILPHLKRRPVALVRGPSGIAGALFFQKHADRIGIQDLEELDASLWPGHKSLLSIPSTQALVSAAQLNVIEFHTWNITVDHHEQPDRVIFDLDPGKGVTWSLLQEAATLTRGFLEQLGLQSWLKTSGGKGLHVVVPLAPKADYETVAAFSKAVVQHIAKTVPSRFVDKSGGANRVGKIFIDYLRNSHGATTASAFSARARPGLGVSMPVSWEQLDSLTGGAQWTIQNAAPYLESRTTDPWAGYWKSKQTLTKARAAIEM